MDGHHCTPEHLHEVIMKSSRFASKTVKESATTAPEVSKGTNFDPAGVGTAYESV